MRIRIINGSDLSGSVHPYEERELRVGDCFDVRGPDDEGYITYEGSDGEEYLIFPEEWEDVNLKRARIRITDDGDRYLHTRHAHKLEKGDCIYVDRIDEYGRAFYTACTGFSTFIPKEHFEVVKQTMVEITRDGRSSAYHPDTDEDVKEGDSFAVDEIDQGGNAFYETNSGDKQMLAPFWFRVVQGSDEAAPTHPCCCSFLILSQLGCQCGGVR
jgi:hypothetical protein